MVKSVHQHQTTGSVDNLERNTQFTKYCAQNTKNPGWLKVEIYPVSSLWQWWHLPIILGELGGGIWFLFFWVSLENARKILRHEWHMVSVVSDCMAKRHKKHCVCCISFIKNPWSKKPDIHNKVMKFVSRNCHQNSLWTFYKHRKKAGVTKSGSDYGCFVIRTAGCSLVKE